MDQELSRLLREVQTTPADAEVRLRYAQALRRAGHPAQALDAVRAAADLGPLEAGAEALRRELFAEVCAPILDDARARALIGEALGRAGPLADPPAADTFHVHGAAQDAAGRVAWIEELQEASDERGGVYARLDLKVASAGQLLLAWELPTYNPYFGCELHRLHWCGERVIAVYREKHACLLAVVPLEGEPQVVEVDEAHVLLDDLILFRSREPTLLEALALPGLEPRCPLPVPGHLGFGSPPLKGDHLRLHSVADPVEHTAGGLELDALQGVRLPTPQQRRWPQNPIRFPSAVVRALGGEAAPQLATDLLVGALTHAFWLDRHHRRAEYDRTHRAWNDPAWLPVVWHRHLCGTDGAAASAFLAHLRALAQEAPAAAGWDPAWGFTEGAVRLAASHVRRRCALLAACCQGGHRLPRGRYDGFWFPESLERFREVRPLFPLGFQEALDRLSDADAPPL